MPLIENGPWRFRKFAILSASGNSEEEAVQALLQGDVQNWSPPKAKSVKLVLDDQQRDCYSFRVYYYTRKGEGDYNL